MALDQSTYGSIGGELGEILGGLLPIPYGGKLGKAAGTLGGYGLGSLFGGGQQQMGMQQGQQQMGEGNILGEQQQIPGYGTLARTSPYSQEQQQALSQLLQQSLQGLGSGEGGSDALARRQFEQQTIPGIAERFSAMGGQRSSAFGQQLGAAGADLEAQLGANRDQRLMQMLQMGLQPQLETAYLPEKPSAWGQFGGQALQGLLSGLGSLGGQYLSNRSSENNMKILADLLKKQGS